MLEQLKSGFKRAINRNKYQLKVITHQQNPCLDYLMNPSFQGANRLFVLLFTGNTVSKEHKEYFMPSTKIKDYHVMIDKQNVFVQAKKIIQVHDRSRIWLHNQLFYSYYFIPVLINILRW